MHRDIAITTLDAMGWGPLHDEKDGGFFRYSRRADWASLTGEAARRERGAARSLRRRRRDLELARYAERAEDILRYVQTWLADPVDGGWAGSQRADPEYYAAEGAGPRRPRRRRSIARSTPTGTRRWRRRRSRRAAP